MKHKETLIHSYAPVEESIAPMTTHINDNSLLIMSKGEQPSQLLASKDTSNDNSFIT